MAPFSGLLGEETEKNDGQVGLRGPGGSSWECVNASKYEAHSLQWAAQVQGDHVPDPVTAGPMLSYGYKGTCFCLWPVSPGLELQPSPFLSLSSLRPTDSPSIFPSSTPFCCCFSWRHLPYNSSLWITGYISLQPHTHTYRGKCEMQQHTCRNIHN